MKNSPNDSTRSNLNLCYTIRRTSSILDDLHLSNVHTRSPTVNHLFEPASLRIGVAFLRRLSAGYPPVHPQLVVENHHVLNCYEPKNHGSLNRAFSLTALKLLNYRSFFFSPCLLRETQDTNCTLFPRRCLVGIFKDRLKHLTTIRSLERPRFLLLVENVL